MLRTVAVACPFFDMKAAPEGNDSSLPIGIRNVAELSGKRIVLTVSLLFACRLSARTVCCSKDFREAQEGKRRRKRKRR